MKKLFLLILLSVRIIPVSFAQGNKTYSIEGTVVLKGSLEPIPFAQVVIKEINQWGFTNEDGEFKIPGVFAGNYTLQSVALGYVTYELPVTVTRDIRGIRIQMQEENLTLDEVVVTAKRGSSINSSERIDKTAIEHVQASSIADVMQLLPGAVIKNPTLTEANQIQIRSISDDGKLNNSRGVGFLVNGTQISNDASMGAITNSGLITVPVIDFRNYATDNIESVEVLKGVISAEYGDVTSGAVLVTTKAGRTPFEVRFKTDPRTKAVSANKGFSLSGNGGYMNVDFDYARATSDLRSPVSTFDRANIGLTYSNTFNRNKSPFRFNARLTGSFTGNSVKSDPDVAKDDFSKVRNKNIMLSLYGSWMLNKSWISSLNYNVSGSYAGNSSHNYVVTTQSPLPTTHSREDGTSAGYFTQMSDIRDRYIDDVPVYVNAKLSGNLNKKAGGILFKTILGLEWNSKGNLGDGVSYKGAMPQYFRQHKYSETPFMHNFAAFLEEKATVPLAKTSLEISAGVRFTKMMIKGYSYNPTLDPRLNARWHIIRNRRKSFLRDFSLRGGWGIMQKLPSISVLYPGEKYIDRAVFQYADSHSGESLAVINTSVIPDKLNYNILAVKTRNMEIGADFNLGGIGIGITYFNENLKDGISDNSWFTAKEIFYYNSVTGVSASPKFEDGKVWIKNPQGAYVEASGVYRSEFLPYSTPDNRNRQRKWGIEYDLNFGKIKPLNTTVLVNGSYIKSKNTTEGLAYDYRGGSDPLNPQEDFPYISVFGGNDSQMSNGVNRERLVTSVSLVTNIPKIRMVVSLTTQCIWMDRYWNTFDKGNVYYEDESGKPVFGDFEKQTVNHILYRDPAAYIDFAGNRRPFSDYYTTADSDLRFRLSRMRLTTNESYYYAVNSYSPYFMANIRVTKEIGKLAAVSFYANNFTNSKPIMKNHSRPNAVGSRKNTDIYFGAELRLTF